MLRQLLALGSALLVTASLTAQSEDFGQWITLFNGKDLTGWQHAKHGPGQNPPNNWAAGDGMLTNRKQGGAGNDICTVEEFDDYELEVEYKIPPKGNSGVYLRGQIEIQIYDSHWKIAAKKKLESVDAGAIYGGSFVALKNAQKEPGTWNKYRVLHVGHRITVWHNDVLIQDNIFQDNKTGGAMGHYPGTDRKLTKDRGPLMLQGDHTEVSYRNIRIRPLFKGGWRWRWNGADLSQFTARNDRRSREGPRWEIRDRAFTNTHTGGQGHDIWTRESFGNFLAYYCYKVDTRARDEALDRPIRDRSGNSGFYLRDQWEIQIHARQSTREAGGGAKHSDGALYSIHAPMIRARHEPDQWNHMFVKLVGKEIWVWQNGKLLHDGAVCPTRTDNHRRKTLEFSKGPFKLQGDHGKVWFSALQVKPLPDDPAATAGKDR